MQLAGSVPRPGHGSGSGSGSGSGGGGVPAGLALSPSEQRRTARPPGRAAANQWTGRGSSAAAAAAAGRPPPPPPPPPPRSSAALWQQRADAVFNLPAERERYLR